MKGIKGLLFMACCFAVSGHVASAQTTIDFETIPGNSTPAEGDNISTQFQSSYGVTFSLIDPITYTISSQKPRLARVGGNSYFAFQGPPGQSSPDCQAPAVMFDMPRSDQDVGCWFLTDDGLLGPTTPAYGLLVQYNDGVASAASDIIDIDGGGGSSSLSGEAWSVRAYSTQTPTSTDTPIAEVRLCSTAIANNNSTNANCDTTAIVGDGVATRWQLDAPNSTQLIKSIVIIPDGPRARKIGLAFDNFTPNTFPTNPPIDPCCPPFTISNLSEFYAIGKPNFYSLQYAPSAATHSQMKAYANYVGQTITVTFAIFDTGPTGNSTPVPLGSAQTVSWSPDPASNPSPNFFNLTTNAIPNNHYGRVVAWLAPPPPGLNLPRRCMQPLAVKTYFMLAPARGAKGGQTSQPILMIESEKGGMTKSIEINARRAKKNKRG